MFRRAISLELQARLSGERSFIQIVVGPRQTGKTTAVKQALDACDIPFHYVNADRLMGSPASRLAIEWEQARLLAQREGKAILFVDEIQKTEDWAGTVKALWDEDTWNELSLLVVLSGSSTLLLQKGMSDSLKGRYELLRSTHWLFSEMRDAFDYSFEDFLLRGGYPGAARLEGEQRWRSYINDSIIDATLSQDILQLENVRKPALLRRLFELGALYSGQELSYRKILGQLDDKGNTETIAHYLDLLNDAGMLAGLQKFNKKRLEERRSSPRFMIYDTSLMTAVWRDESSQLLEDSTLRGRLMESAVGAYLLARSKTEGFELRWWRDGDLEVDFVLRRGDDVTGIEVKSGAIGDLRGLETFKSRFPEAIALVVGTAAAPMESFLLGEIPLF